MERRKTYVIDIDGTLLTKKVGSRASIEWFDDKVPTESALRFLDQCEKEGACIILLTARRESLRAVTEALLKKHCIYYDQLVMGAGNGERILINDGPCTAYELQPNEGFHGLCEE